MFDSYIDDEGFHNKLTKHENGVIVFSSENPFILLKPKPKSEKFVSLLVKGTYTYKQLKEHVAYIISYYGFWFTKNCERETEIITKEIFELTKGNVDEGSMMRIKKSVQIHFEKMESMNQY